MFIGGALSFFLEVSFRARNSFLGLFFRAFHVPFIGRPRTSHGVSKPRTPQGRSTDAPRTFHGHPTNTPRTVHGLSTDCPRTFQSMGNRWGVHGWFMDSPRTVRGYSVDSPWGVLGLCMDTVRGQHVNSMLAVRGQSVDMCIGCVWTFRVRGGSMDSSRGAHPRTAPTVSMDSPWCPWRGICGSHVGRRWGVRGQPVGCA